MISALLSSIVPTFGIMFVGWFARRVGIWGKASVDVLNNYAYYIALPALIFHALIITDISSRNFASDGLLIAGVLLAHVLVVILCVPFLLWRKMPVGTRATLPMLITFGSTAYLGIPYATFTFGTEGTVLASLLSVALVVVVLFVSLLILNQFARPSIKKDVLHTMLELPFLWAVLLGIAWPFLRLPDIPLFADRFIAILSDSAGPTALLGLGAFLYDIRVRTIPWGYTLLFSGLKVLAPTAATYAVLTLFNVSGLPLFVGLAMAATSTAVTAFILSTQYKLGQQLTAGVILLSVFFSLIVLTVLSAFWVVS